ncbi:MAG: hypothetical protein EAZ30_14645 [Betaproteobacteria bacterium]|nr:MAG: hypothetical protein EAZ30_14645 [Betaproteobacteria bacterium]
MSQPIEPIRISKIMASRGIASRTEADRMIERGWVSVDGRVAASGDRALPDAVIVLSKEAQSRIDDAFTVVLNKPRGFVSSPDETNGARALGLLVHENYCGLGQAPNLSAYGLRVAGRLAVSESGLVVYTTDTALARRLAASDVEESWTITFLDDSDDINYAAARIVAALQLSGQEARISTTAARTVSLDTSSLVKGQLSEVLSSFALRASVMRTRRGEIALGDVTEAQWRLA